VLRLTRELRTVLVLGLARAASDKVLAASTSSTFDIRARGLLLVFDPKAHERCASVEGTMCKSKIQGHSSRLIKLIKR
jgi:hypothetical protein